MESSRLFSKQWIATTTLPKLPGKSEAAGSITSHLLSHSKVERRLVTCKPTSRARQLPYGAIRHPRSKTCSSLHCKSLIASTIARYLLDVAKLLGHYQDDVDPRHYRDVDPQFRSTADTRLAPEIAYIVKAIQVPFDS